MALKKVRVVVSDDEDSLDLRRKIRSISPSERCVTPATATEDGNSTTSYSEGEDDEVGFTRLAELEKLVLLLPLHSGRNIHPPRLRR